MQEYYDKWQTRSPAGQHTDVARWAGFPEAGETETRRRIYGLQAADPDTRGPCHQNTMEMYDLHATMLRLLGLDHTRLTWRFSSRYMRLADVRGHVVHDWIA